MKRNKLTSMMRKEAKTGWEREERKRTRHLLCRSSPEICELILAECVLEAIASQTEKGRQALHNVLEDWAERLQS